MEKLFETEFIGLKIMIPIIKIGLKKSWTLTKKFFVQDYNVIGC